MDLGPMDPAPAPLFAEIAQGPTDGAAYWVKTADGLRIRAALWPAKAPARGTVLLFPGRTEYIEKYGTTAAALAQRGYATLTVDWRGQGLADRMLDNRKLGHVARFADFQLDVAALIALANQIDTPGPRFLIGHSMGGAIGLRALMQGLSVRACCFTGPMWGIQIPPLLRPVAHLLCNAAPLLRLDTALVPTSSAEQYVQVTPFDDNTLTSDAQMYQLMVDQLQAQPDLALGGPTLRWLREALRDCADLALQPSPPLPCLTFLGTDEQIVEPGAIHDRMARWPGGQLELIQNARHEVLMETPDIRDPGIDQICTLFDTHGS